MWYIFCQCLWYIFHTFFKIILCFVTIKKAKNITSYHKKKIKTL